MLLFLFPLSPTLCLPASLKGSYRVQNYSITPLLLKIHHLFSINEPSFGFHGIIYFWILLLKRNILVISRAYFHFNILSEKDENDDNYFGHYLPLVRHYFSGSIVLCHSMKHLFSLFSLSSPQRGGSVVLLAHTWPEAHMCICQPFNIFSFIIV